MQSTKWYWIIKKVGMRIHSIFSRFKLIYRIVVFFFLKLVFCFICFYVLLETFKALLLFLPIFSMVIFNFRILCKFFDMSIFVDKKNKAKNVFFWTIRFYCDRVLTILLLPIILFYSFSAFLYLIFFLFIVISFNFL